MNVEIADFVISGFCDLLSAISNRNPKITKSQNPKSAISHEYIRHLTNTRPQ